MKKFVYLLLAAASVSTLAACSSKATLRDAIRKDIEQYMTDYAKSVEFQQCKFANVDSEKLFTSIPMLKQMEKVSNLAYDMESMDGRKVVSCLYSKTGFKQVTKVDGKIKEVLLYNDGKAYRSEDGILFAEVAGGTEQYAAIQFGFDSVMRAQKVAKKVAIQTFDAYDFSDGSANGKIVAEPLEMMVGDVRCNRFFLLCASNNYSAEIDLYVSCDEFRNIIRRDVRVISGLNAEDFNGAIDMERFMTTGSGFVVPGCVASVPAEGKDAFTIKNIQLNKALPADAFQPEEITRD